MPLTYVSCGFTLDNGVTVLSKQQMVKPYFKFSFQDRSDFNFLHGIEDKFGERCTSNQLLTLKDIISCFFKTENFDDIFEQIIKMAPDKDARSYFVQIENIDDEDYSFRQECYVMISEGRISYSFSDME